MLAESRSFAPQVSASSGEYGATTPAKATTLMKNSCLITVDTPHAHLLMSDYGAAFGLYGYVRSTTLRPTSIKLDLKQKQFCETMRGHNREEAQKKAFRLAAKGLSVCTPHFG
jgi:hypothetical protein